MAPAKKTSKPPPAATLSDRKMAAEIRAINAKTLGEHLKVPSALIAILVGIIGLLMKGGEFIDIRAEAQRIELSKEQILLGDTLLKADSTDARAAALHLGAYGEFARGILLEGLRTRTSGGVHRAIERSLVLIATQKKDAVHTIADLRVELEDAIRRDHRDQQFRPSECLRVLSAMDAVLQAPVSGYDVDVPESVRDGLRTHLEAKLAWAQEGNMTPDHRDAFVGSVKTVLVRLKELEHALSERRVKWRRF